MNVEYYTPTRHYLKYANDIVDGDTYAFTSLSQPNKTMGIFYVLEIVNIDSSNKNLFGGRITYTIKGKRSNIFVDSDVLKFFSTKSHIELSYHRALLLEKIAFL
tara:strand:- start:2259 stop:2570 length:312 start_codon:yes stop_codon:yes gene_type:complete